MEGCIRLTTFGGNAHIGKVPITLSMEVDPLGTTKRSTVTVFLVGIQAEVLFLGRDEANDRILVARAVGI